MKEETEDNMLIAEFMGNKMNGVFYISGYDANFPTQRLVHPNDLEYHESWDWLIPVVDKIRDNNCIVSIRFNRQINTTNTHISCFENKWLKDINISGVGIESTYKSVIEFIKWYNSLGFKYESNRT